MNNAKREARRIARRGAVEVLARVDRPASDAELFDDVILLLHQVPDRWMRRMVEVVEMMHGLAQPATYSEICSGPADEPRFTVTFDDGNKSQMAAATRLAELGISACFFVIADAIDARPADADQICRDQLWIEPEPFMNSDDLDALLAMGHEVGSHTLGHVNLSTCSTSELDAQLGDSRQKLSRWLGDDAHFAWPYGRAEHFSRPAHEAVGRADYATCAAALRGSGLHKFDDQLPPIVLRQSLHLDDSVAVQRRFVMRGEQSSAASAASLSYLRR